MRKAITLPWLVVALVLCTSAKEKPQEYQLTGTVVSFHAQAEVSGRGKGTNGNDRSSVGTYERRVYVIKTDTGTLEITAWERGHKQSKRPPLTVGQQLKYRTDGIYLYAVLSDGNEHRCYLMLAAMEDKK